MKELNLSANTPTEQKILDYLRKNASETLIDKINNGTPFEKDGKSLINKKTLSGFMKYAAEEARKSSEKGAACACIEDSVVYGWAAHYFEEDSIEGTLFNPDGTEYTTAVKKSVAVSATPKPKKQSAVVVRYVIERNRRFAVNRRTYRRRYYRSASRAYRRRSVSRRNLRQSEQGDEREVFSLTVILPLQRTRKRIPRKHISVESRGFLRGTRR